MGEATDLEDVLVAGMIEAATRISGHAAWPTWSTTSPRLVLGHLAFDDMDRLLAVTPRASPRRSWAAG